jgi:hypothetical protein
MAAYPLFKHGINILKLNNSHKYCALFQNGALSSKPLRLLKGFRFLKEKKTWFLSICTFLKTVALS